MNYRLEIEEAIDALLSPLLEAGAVMDPTWIKGHKLHHTEKHVSKLPSQVEREISLKDAERLKKSGNYRKGIGLYRGETHRRRIGTGTLHLRTHKDKAWLHWDKWDPKKHPVKHVAETPPLLKMLGVATAAGIARHFLKKRK